MPSRPYLAFLALLLAHAAVAPAQTPLHTELAATGLNRPVFLTAPPGDFARLFVVEQQGRIMIVRNGTVLAVPFLDLVGTGSVSFGGERGLLGLAFHPDYASNGQFFVYHNTPPFVNAVVRRFQRSANDPDRADPDGEGRTGWNSIMSPLVRGARRGRRLFGSATVGTAPLLSST